MTIRRLILLLVSIAAIAILSACGSSSSSPTPPPPPTPITVTFQTAPPGFLFATTATSATAVVANDSSNAGVDWTVTCGSPGACGSFSPTHTASGTATTYTAPAVVPAGNTVTITATSTANTAKSVSATITIVASFSNGSLNGSYVFEVLGTDASTFFLYQLAGVLAADGNGAITGGELTYSNQSFVVTDAITGGSYSIGADGRGTITVNTTDPTIGEAGILTFDVVVASTSRALITQFDTSATSSGTMDLQTAVAAPTGGYAFVVNGDDLAFDVMAIGGVFNIDSPGTISGAGSVADIDIVGNIFNSLTVTGTVSAPDSFGAVTVDLTINGTLADQFIGYIVDATHIMLVESDANGSTAGQAIGQGAATGTFLDDTALSGTFVYGIPGQSQFGTAAFAGLFTADGAGLLTNGFTDENLAGVVVIGDTLTGTYAVDPSGTGRTPALTNFGSNGAGPTLIFYLTGNGNPPLVLNTDTFSLGGGIAPPQAVGPFSFNGPYGMNFTINDSSGNETDGNAQVTADGLAGTYAGTVDVNIEDFFAGTITPTPDVPLSGAFTSNANGRFPGTLTANTLTVSTAVYVVDATQGFIIETDSQQVAIGPFVTQQ